MSEPWIQDDSFSTNMKFAGSHPIKSSSSLFDGAQTPQDLLEKYSSVYNRNGRIGIYTREERDAIIARFHAKRRKRVWKKKIRYACRKNLADRRIRVGGRFVKGSTAADNQHKIVGKLPLSGSSGRTTASSSGKPPAPKTSTRRQLALKGIALRQEEEEDDDEEDDEDDEDDNVDDRGANGVASNPADIAKALVGIHRLPSAGLSLSRIDTSPAVSNLDPDSDDNEEMDYMARILSGTQTAGTPKRMRRHSIAY
jgi:CCT motif